MIGVMGAGAFGTALAVSLARRGDPVTLWAHDPAHVDAMAKTRDNARRLPGVVLADNITLSPDIPAKGPLLLAVPMQRLRAVLETHADALTNRPLVAACKGIDLETHLGPVETIAQVIPGAQPAILTGPSFAADIARGLPTALTLACADAALGERLQQALTTPNIRIYRTTDTQGAELGGALKNVIAIAAGAAIGHGMGDSARAALMTRGFAEIRRLATSRGADPETLMGLSGFGDLVLTCTSDLSRNYRYGLALGRQQAFDQGTTVEGVATARAVTDWARDLGVDMPICSAVAALCAGTLSVAEALRSLLSRPLKEE